MVSGKSDTFYGTQGAHSIPSVLGVRNHEAKKIMKEKMKVGDEVCLQGFPLCPHTLNTPPSVIGVVLSFQL